MQVEQYSGPLPPPAALEKYEQILPGAAERILKMAELQAGHRQSLEKIVVESNSRQAFFGVVASLLISFGFLWVCYYAISQGHAWSAAILGTVNIASLVWAFMYGTSSNRQERMERNRATPKSG